MIDLSGKHVLLVGGEVAIIKSIMERVEQAGATVTVLHHQIGLVRKLGSKARLIKSRDSDTVRNILSEFDTIDGIIICPQFRPSGRFIDKLPLEWAVALYDSYEFPVYVSQAAAKHMIENKVAGSIIFLTSVATLMPLVDTSVYGTSLAMLSPLAKMAAVDCGKYGIRVNMIAMGWIESESTQTFLTDDGKAFIEQGIPLGHIGSPQAIGDTCCFLLSDLSHYMTGTVLTVDGGYTLTRSDGQSPYPTPVD